VEYGPEFPLRCWVPEGCNEPTVSGGCGSVEVEVNLRPTVSRPVCLGARRPSGTCDQCFLLLEISFRQLRVCYFVAPSLTRGPVCNLLYNCLWPCQSSHSQVEVPQNSRIYFTVSSETPPTRRARFPYLYSPGTGSVLTAVLS
jgi:hypothetical protein